MFSADRARSWKGIAVISIIIVLTLLSGNDLVPRASAQTTAATLTEWSLPDSGSGPWGIAVDQNGKIWFSENMTNRITMFDPSTNGLREWDIPSGGSNPKYIFLQAVGTSVRVYFTEFGTDKVGFFDNATKTFFEWSLPNTSPYCGSVGGGCKPVGITVDTVTGDMWFTESNAARIGRLAPGSNLYTEYVLPALPAPGTNLMPWGITFQRTTTIFGSNIFVWFTELGNNAIGRLEASSQTLTLFSLSSLGNPFSYNPSDIKLDTSGNIIFTNVNSQSNRISVLRNQTSTVADFAIPTAQAKPTTIEWDPTRNVAWFAEYGAGKVSSLSTSGGVFQLVAVTQCTIPGGAIGTGPSPCASGAGINGPTTISSPATNVRDFRGSPNPNILTPLVSTISPLQSNQFSEYPLPASNSAPNGVDVDAAGNVWFTEQQPAGNKIGRMTIVVPFNFGITASPSSRTVVQGGTTNYTVNLNLLAGSSTTVTLSISSSVPSGVTTSFSTLSADPSFTSLLNVGTSAATPAGSYLLSIQASGGGVVKTATVTLIVAATPPPPSFDFTLSVVGSTSANITAGDSASYNLQIGQVGTSTPQTVQLFASSLPSGVTASFNPTTGIPSFTSTLTLLTTTDATPGTYTITITGTGGGQTHPTSVTLKINAALSDFTISASPNSFNIPQASSATFSVTVQSLGVFSNPVSLTASNLPPGVSVSFSSNPITPTAGGSVGSTATVSVSRSAPKGTYGFTITGTSGSLIKPVTISVTISGCLIATATYGSELSPEVQFLRDFRDYQILHTFAGTSFMYVFDAWYYSFSPTVAHYIATHEGVKIVMKYVLYPLIGLLHVSSETYSLFAFEPEFAALAAGIVASSLIGLIYVALPLSGVLWFARRKLHRGTESRIAKWLAALFVGLIAGFTISEVLMLPLAMIIVSAAIILTTLTAASLLPAFWILEYAKRRL